MPLQGHSQYSNISIILMSINKIGHPVNQAEQKSLYNIHHVNVNALFSGLFKEIREVAAH